MRFASSEQGDLVTGGFAGAWLRELNLVGLGMDHGCPREGKGPRKGPRWKCPVLSVLGSLGTVRTVQYSTVVC
jgi:hypothetical protein